MKPLYDYITEGNKEEYYHIKSTTDKYYTGIKKGFYGLYLLTFEKAEQNGWWIPDKKLTPEQRKELHWLQYPLSNELGQKNPVNGKKMGVVVNNRYSSDDGIELEVCVQWKGEDTSESIAACIDYILNKFNEKVPGERRKDYKGILKDVRKELLDMYHRMPEPMSRKDREALHKFLSQGPLAILTTPSTK